MVRLKLSAEAHAQAAERPGVRVALLEASLSVRCEPQGRCCCIAEG